MCDRSLWGPQWPSSCLCDLCPLCDRSLWGPQWPSSCLCDLCPLSVGWTWWLASNEERMAKVMGCYFQDQVTERPACILLLLTCSLAPLL